MPKFPMSSDVSLFSSFARSSMLSVSCPLRCGRFPRTRRRHAKCCLRYDRNYHRSHFTQRWRLLRRSHSLPGMFISPATHVARLVDYNTETSLACSSATQVLSYWSKSLLRILQLSGTACSRVTFQRTLSPRSYRSSDT